MALPPSLALVIATWIAASWMVEHWDRFPHLAITSPEKRCGKTRLLQLIECVVRNPYNVANISPAAIYQLVELENPTLLMDESQSLSRPRASESAEVRRELLNSGIDRDACVIRCGGKRMDEIRRLKFYGPKAFALIGEVDGVLADRCLSIPLERKTAEQHVERYTSRVVKPIGETIRGTLEAWAAEHGEQIKYVYDRLEPFPIENDRMAELLLPLQAVLTVVDTSLLPKLERYAKQIDQAELERVSSGVLLLMACKQLIGKQQFVSTAMLLQKLAARIEEPWGRWNRGEPINAESLARLLKPYGIKPDREQRKLNGNVSTTRGYYAKDFADAWMRYLPPSPK